MSLSTVEVFLPKFKLESKFTLNNSLSQLGMPDVFDIERADLSGMSDMAMYVSHVVHKAYVDVNEEGTEAAAATAGVVTLRSLPSTHSFVADHPFMFVIRDVRAGIPLFVGRVKVPPVSPGRDSDGREELQQQQQQMQQRRY